MPGQEVVVANHAVVIDGDDVRDKHNHLVGDAFTLGIFCVVRKCY